MGMPSDARAGDRQPDVLIDAADGRVFLFVLRGFSLTSSREWQRNFAASTAHLSFSRLMNVQRLLRLARRQARERGVDRVS